jgi:UDP-galactopyranose mutase
MYDFLIVGAGLFGSVFARQATKAGKKCLVIEQRNHIGGNCYTEKHRGIEIHKYGPHVFHTNDKLIWDYINQFGEFNNYAIQAIAIIEGEAYSLPFDMGLFSQLFKVTKPEQVMSIINSESKRYKNKKPKNLEEYAIKTFGKTVYEKFIKGYTEKQWGRNGKSLPVSIIKRLPIKFVYNTNYNDDIYHGIPINGYTTIFKKLLKGTKVKLNTSYKDIKDKVKADKIIYTGMIDEYFDYKFGSLNYRSLTFTNKEYQCPNYQGCAVINYPSKEVPWTRSIEHKHFVGDMTSPRTIISYEFPTEYLVAGGQIPYYPINDCRNDNLYNKYLKLAKKTPNVYFGGRLGSYKYYEMDDVIEDSLKLANSLL